jgi:tRNA threonylcarbamoyladenosine biosynthesis protein TsaE
MDALLKRFGRGIETATAEETLDLAEAFAAVVPPDTVLAFHGDLGAGKTTFIRGMARHWKIVEPVTSPTYNLYSIYEGTRQLIHLDAYRLNSGSDLDALMLEDFLASPWCLAVEWPERIPDSLPENTWHLYLEITPEYRHSIRSELPNT